MESKTKTKSKSESKSKKGKYKNKEYDENKVRMIQSLWKKYINGKRCDFPYILKQAKRYIKSNPIIINDDNDDGRIGSCIDEMKIKNLFVSHKHFKKYVKIPEKRWWWDISFKDVIYGWIPVNIKTTTTNTADNIGGLTLCVQSYTDHKLDLNKNYNGGKMVDILLDKLKNKKYNKDSKKDYFFIVINKKTNDIIINSMLGLSKLTPNKSNLPFQVKWKDNKKFNFINIKKSIELYLDASNELKNTWQAKYISGMSGLKY